MAFQLHQKGSCTDCISEEFLHSLHFFFSFVFFLSYLKKKKEDFLFSSSYCRHSTATLALETQARRLGGQCHPSFNILLSTKKKQPKNEKRPPKKISDMINHLGKRLVPSGQTVLLDSLYSKWEKTKRTKKKSIIFLFLP